MTWIEQTIAELRRQIDQATPQELRAIIAQLEKQIAELEALKAQQQKEPRHDNHDR